MRADSDRALLEECLSHLAKVGFVADALTPYQSSIGGAAVRLAKNILAKNEGLLVHPLGFGRIPLTPWSMDQPRAAVHIWDGNAGLRQSEDIHDHCYDFISLCHVGGLRHRIFDVAQEATEVRLMAMAYAAGSCTTARSSGQLRDIKIAEIRTVQVTTGEACSFSHDVFHSAEATSEFTLTVQFQSPWKKSEATVFRAEGWQSLSSSTSDLRRLATALARVSDV